MMRAWMCLLLALAALPARAGLWDRDRPADTPDYMDAILGRFERYPTAYYLGRQQWLQHELSKMPANTVTEDKKRKIADTLTLLDDDAVAAMRSGSYTKAMAVLNGKDLTIASISDSLTARAKEAATRSAANRAAFLHWKWKQDGSAADLREALGLLDGVLADDRYNTDAQWSRREIAWLIEKPAWDQGGDPVFPNLLGLRDVAFRGDRDDNALARAGVNGCLAFLARRITYEEGWHEVDVMYAFSLALALCGRQDEALFAWLRVCELIDGGAKTVVAGAAKPDALKRLMGKHVEAVATDAARELFEALRKEADARAASRADYVTAQVKQGRHPDTHPAFWNDWDAKPAPADGGDGEERESAISSTMLFGSLAGLAVVLLLIFGFTVVLGRRGPASPNVDEV